jgi:hypothetical protein
VGGIFTDLHPRKSTLNEASVAISNACGVDNFLQEPSQVMVA